MNTTKYRVEAIRPQCDHRTSIERLTSSISGKFGLFIEMVWNSHEHGQAKHIWIIISGKGSSYTVTIIDDGTGMDAARRQRSLNMAQAAKVQTGRNYQDLGLKRLAAEFKNVEVYTISAAEKAADPDGYPMWVMKYDFDELMDILATNANKTIAAEPHKPNWKRMELLEGSTGTRIHLTGVRPGRSNFTVETLRRELCNYLPPWVAEKVYVNGLPLDKRQIVGEPFRLQVPDHPRLGRVDLDLYIPTSVKSQRDQLKIGPFEGVCDWHTFCEEIPAELLSDRLAILSEGIYGEIHVENFKDWVSASRREFEAGLFANLLIRHFVDFMELEVVPLLEKQLGIIRKREESEEDKRLLAELQEFFAPLSGKSSPPPPSILKLDTSFIELLPSSEAVVINVDKYDPTKTLVWDDSACGGRIQILDGGKKVKYKPGPAVGGYELLCSYREQPDVKAGVDISIVAQKKLRVHPARITIRPGRTAVLIAKNWEDDSSGEENLRWRRVDPADEGRFVVESRRGKELREIGFSSKATYQAGNTLGTYRVEVFDIKNRQKIAHTDVTVAEPPEPPPGPTGTDGNNVNIQGTLYDLGFEYLEKSPFLSRLYSGKRLQIKINKCHPVCIFAKKYGTDCLRDIAVHQVILRHIARTSPGLSPEQVTHEVANLYSQLVKQGEKSEL